MHPFIHMSFFRHSTMCARVHSIHCISFCLNDLNWVCLRSGDTNEKCQKMAKIHIIYTYIIWYVHSIMHFPSVINSSLSFIYPCYVLTVRFIVTSKPIPIILGSFLRVCVCVFDEFCVLQKIDWLHYIVFDIYFLRSNPFSVFFSSFSFFLTIFFQMFLVFVVSLWLTLLFSNFPVPFLIARLTSVFMLANWKLYSLSLHLCCH